MFLIYTQICNQTTYKTLKNRGLSFTAAMLREKCALFGVNFIDRLLQKHIHLPPVIA